MIHSNGPHSIVSFKCRKLSVKVRAWGFSPLNGFPKLPQPLGCSLQTSGKKGREGGREGGRRVRGKRGKRMSEEFTSSGCQSFIPFL